MQTLSKRITFSEFLEWHPENSRFELIDGIVIEMQSTGQHEEIGKFLRQS